MEYPGFLIDDTFDVLKIALSEARGVIDNAHVRMELLIPDTGLGMWSSRFLISRRQDKNCYINSSRYQPRSIIGLDTPREQPKNNSSVTTLQWPKRALPKTTGTSERRALMVCEPSFESAETRQKCWLGTPHPKLCRASQDGSLYIDCTPSPR